MEHVAAAELLASLNVPKTDAALQLASFSVWAGGLDILELLQLINELPPLVERMAALSQSRQVVDDLTEDVDGQSSAAHNEEEEFHVDQEVTRVKHQRDAVEYKLLLKPLLPVGQLAQRHLVLEVVLYGLEQKSSEL